MNLFGCKFQDEFGTPDRKNFDSLLWATVTVFQVGSQINRTGLNMKIKYDLNSRYS